MLSKRLVILLIIAVCCIVFVVGSDKGEYRSFVRVKSVINVI